MKGTSSSTRAVARVTTCEAAFAMSSAPNCQEISGSVSSVGVPSAVPIVQLLLCAYRLWKGWP